MKRLPDNPLANPDGVIVLAHRGWRGRYPENTMLSFQQAAALGVDALEMDIHSTADGVLVVFHDDTLERTTNGRGPIHALTWAELQQLDAGYNWTNDGGQTYPFRGQGLTVPALSEIFTAFPDFWLNVDIKQRQPTIVRPFAQMIREYGLARQLCVASFHTETSEEFRREFPEVVTSASLSETRRLLILNKLRLGRFYRGQGRAFQPPEYEGALHVVTRRFVEDAHRHNVAVHVWTVNEISDMERLIDMGVDGLITDFPDRLLRLLGRMEPNEPPQRS